MLPFMFFNETLLVSTSGNVLTRVVSFPVFVTVSALPSSSSLSPGLLGIGGLPPGPPTRLRAKRAINATAITTRTNNPVPMNARIHPTGERRRGGMYGGTVDGYCGGTVG